MKNLSSLVFVAAAAALVVLVALMFPQAQTDPDFARKENLPGVKNFARLMPNIWRGHAPDENGLETLKKLGVKTVIDFRTHDENGQWSGDPAINYVRLPFKATDPPPREVVDGFLEIVTDPANEPVFFHCRYGKDRTGAMAALYRIKVQGWNPEKAVREMKHFGFRSIYRDLIGFVRSLEPSRMGVQEH